MLTAIHVGNFKAFADSQRIPLRPLTLIYGANSSGKSSILHSILLARQAMETGDLDVYRTIIGGDSVDLGGFKQYVHQRNTELRVHLEWEVSSDGFSKRITELVPNVKRAAIGMHVGLSGIDRDLLRKVGDLTPKQILMGLIKTAAEENDQSEVEKLESMLKGIEERLTFEEVTRLGATLGVEKCWLDLDGNRLLSFSSRQKNLLRLDYLQTDHNATAFLVRNLVLAHSTTDIIDSNEINYLTSAIDELVPKISFEIDNLLPKKKDQSSLRYSFVTVKNETRLDDLKKVIEGNLPGIIEEVVIGISDLIKLEFGRIVYLGPLRTYPPRHMGSSERNDVNWIAGGGYAWDVVRKYSQIRGMVNKWLGDGNKLSTSYEMTLRHLLTIKSIETKIDELTSKAASKFLEEWVDESGVARDIHGEVEGALAEIPQRLEELQSLYSEVQELVLLDKRTNTIVSQRDVGIGISQILPVLVTSYSSENKIIAIEQPEIHLHPALQAELGDLFIESALGERKNTMLIESHSEHLLLRIMRRMRETSNGNLPKDIPPVTPADICVLFVEPDGSRSIIREMPLNERGELVKAWPGGFFEEDFRELF